MLSAIPESVVMAGLIGCGIALIVATAQQKWQLKAFFLLALRLAIGWQFLFEGMYKINTWTVGPTETNKVFTSEPYFKASPTPLGEMMRNNYSDPQLVIQDYIGIATDKKAGLCPAVVATQLEALKDATEKAIRDEAAAELAAANAQQPPADMEKAKQIHQDTTANAAKLATERIDAAKADYARWVNGSLGRDTKVKFVSGEVKLTAPQRLHLIEKARDQLREAENRAQSGIGNGNGVELKRITELRNEVVAMETALAKDAQDYVNEIKKELAGDKLPETPAVESFGKQLDRITMWFIAIVGACILFGFLTRINCVLAAGFLLVTYLTHPPFPWYSLPPMTEGNPLFVNKNLIEMFALLVLACYPTGRWLGLDAILALLIPCCRRKNCDLVPGG